MFYNEITNVFLLRISWTERENVSIKTELFVHSQSLSFILTWKFL